MKIGPQPSGLRTRRRILSASAKVFLEKGYAGASSKMVAALAGVSNGSPFFHYGNKEGVLLEFVKLMFSGQFAVAEGLAGGDGDALLLYAVETGLQLHIAELSEPLRELYVTAYTLPSTVAYIHENMMLRLEAIFAPYQRGNVLRDYGDLELASSGVVRSFMLQPCGGSFTMERKLRRCLECCFRIFEVPRERYQPVVDRVLKLDLDAAARQLVEETVRRVDEGYAAAQREGRA